MKKGEMLILESVLRRITSHLIMGFGIILSWRFAIENVLIGSFLQLKSLNTITILIIGKISITAAVDKIIIDFITNLLFKKFNVYLKQK